MIRGLINRRLDLIIAAIGAIIFITGLREFLRFFRNYRLYQFLFQDFPEGIIQIRYYFSLFLRSLSAVVGIGIILRRDIFRKILLVVSFLTILTIYYKHPPACFKQILDSMALPAPLAAKRDLMERILLVYNYSLDLLISIGLIYFFTRPKIKQQFR